MVVSSRNQSFAGSRGRAGRLAGLPGKRYAVALTDLSETCIIASMSKRLSLRAVSLGITFTIAAPTRQVFGAASEGR